jgi:hypothetical protein
MYFLVSACGARAEHIFMLTWCSHRGLQTAKDLRKARDMYLDRVGRAAEVDGRQVAHLGVYTLDIFIQDGVISRELPPVLQLRLLTSLLSSTWAYGSCVRLMPACCM